MGDKSATPPPVELLTRGMISLFNRFSQQPDSVEGPASSIANGNGGGVHMVPTLSDRGNGDDKAKQYKEFIANLKSLGEENPDLVKRIGEFLETINRRELLNKHPIFDDDDVPGSHEEFAHDVHTFLERQARDLETTKFWKNQSEAESVQLREHLERLVMSKIHDHVFAPTESHRVRDELLSAKIQRLQLIIDPVSNLDVKASLNPRTTEFDEGLGWRRAAEELCKISSFKTPREKITCVTNCSRCIIQLIKNKGESPIPDVFIPCLVYVLLQANPKNLHSNIEYLAAYRGQDFMRDERGHYFLHLASAVSFIWRADAKALSMDPEEFANAMTMEIEPRNGAAAVSTMSSPLESVFGSLPSDDWFQARFRFQSAQASKLTLSQVPELLEEYKLLVQVCQDILAKRPGHVVQ